METFEIPNQVSSQLGNLIQQIITVSPEMRPSIEDIEKHPWIMKSEINIPTVTYAVSNVINMPSGMEFNNNEILESQQLNKYDEKMRTYLILKEEVHKVFEHASTTSTKPVDPHPSPPPSQAHPSINGLPPKRRASEPTLGLLHMQPSEEQGPVPLILSGHKVDTSVSMPPTALHCPRRNSSTSSCALHSGAMAAPFVCITTLEDKILLFPEQDFDMETSSPPLKIWVLQETTQENQGLPVHTLLLQEVSENKNPVYIIQEYGSSERGRTQTQ